MDAWLDKLDDATYDTVLAALEFLEEQGPAAVDPSSILSADLVEPT